MENQQETARVVMYSWNQWDGFRTPMCSIEVESSTAARMFFDAAKQYKTMHGRDHADDGLIAVIVEGDQ